MLQTCTSDAAYPFRPRCTRWTGAAGVLNKRERWGLPLFDAGTYAADEADNVELLPAVVNLVAL